MIYSLSEIDAHARKAARGAGFEWGCAEEAGKAARLLAAYQLPGAAVLADYLLQREAQPAGHFQAPAITERHWKAQAEDGVLCPLLTASCIGDRGTEALFGSLMLEKVASPLLLCPYLVLMSRMNDCSLALSWPGVQLAFHKGHVLQQNVADDALQAGFAEWVECARVDSAEAGAEAGNVGQKIAPAIWEQLNEFAKRTYVPATEASRLGAGPAD